jgi:2,5-diketo-D-gluconate reductase A
MQPGRNTPLASGTQVPLIGFGTWDITGDDVRPSVLRALEVGYRHIDTAWGYGNEAEIGAALRESGVPRDEVFLTSKIPPRRIGLEDQTLTGTLRDLGTDRIDLYLIHSFPTEQESPRLWEFLVDARDRGQAISIGVSNYTLEQIDDLAVSTGVPPDVNQIRWTPSLYDRQVAEGLSARCVVLEGFSALRKANLDEPVLLDIAGNHAVTPAQVILRWHIQHRFITLPRSTHRQRIAENFDVWGFELTDEEVARIDALGARGVAA